jgi:hypothetical protein
VKKSTAGPVFKALRPCPAVTVGYSAGMSLELSLPQPDAGLPFNGLEAAPTLTLRGRQRAGALLALDAGLVAEPAPGETQRAGIQRVDPVAVTLTL